MKNTLVLRQIGKFYNALDDDCYILFYLFGYKISNYKSGFPVSALNKVKYKFKNSLYIIKFKSERNSIMFIRIYE